MPACQESRKSIYLSPRYDQGCRLRRTCRRGGRVYKMIDIGYTQCFVDVALCHYGLVRQLRQRGFYTTAIVPRSVYIAGLGLREKAIMCKDFGHLEHLSRILFCKLCLYLKFILFVQSAILTYVENNNHGFRLQKRIRARVCVFVCVSAFVFGCSNARVGMHARVYDSVCMRMYMRACVCMCVYVHVA